MTIPDWVQDAIFYQIFPDRFANGDPSNDPPNVQVWGSPPTRWGFQGGDLRGVIANLEYLLDLGVNALYLNPIFRATSNHRYNTTDYFEIDPRLGTLADFQQLLEACHREHIRVILDGVFNHTGRGFFAFNDVLENGKNSPYLDWYHLTKFPVKAYGRGRAKDFKAWWGLRSLPKLNVETKAVREYIFRVARYWLEQGIDGWRLDVPNEIDDDEFWAEFREQVKDVNPEAYLLGEIWDLDRRWVGPNHFDGVMHYPLRKAILGLLSSRAPDIELFSENLEKLYSHYPGNFQNLQYLPLGSHDTRRVVTVLKGDLGLVKIAFTLLMTYPGAPAIYYGDEIGLPGGKDPDCRRAFPWDRSEWNEDLRRYVARLILLRRSSPILRRGDFRIAGSDRDAGWTLIERRLADRIWYVALNMADEARSVSLPRTDLPDQPAEIEFPLEDQQSPMPVSAELEIQRKSVRVARVVH